MPLSIILAPHKAIILGVQLIAIFTNELPQIKSNPETR